MNTNLKDNIKGLSHFSYYRDGNLWYETETGLLFNVPVEDVGTAQFRATEKSMILMRYIRKYLASIVGDPI